MAVRNSYPVRPGETEDLDFLWEMMYEAAHHRPVSDPAISRYLEDWGRPGDAAVVALDPGDHRRVGAAWYRLMPPERPGYGFVDASTPEIVIAVVPGSEGFDALSLTVRRDNPVALRLYELNGFVKLFDSGSEYPSWTMKVDFAARKEPSQD